MNTMPNHGFKNQVDGKMLIVTSKALIDSWADSCQADLNIKALLYTNTLSDRRKLGIHTIGCHDVVITTFDVRLSLQL